MTVLCFTLPAASDSFMINWVKCLPEFVHLSSDLYDIQQIKKKKKKITQVLHVFKSNSEYPPTTNLPSSPPTHTACPPFSFLLSSTPALISIPSTWPAACEQWASSSLQTSAHRETFLRCIMQHVFPFHSLKRGELVGVNNRGR